MTVFDQQKRQAIAHNFALVVDLLDRKFRTRQVHLQEVPSYLYKGSKAKLEITVLPNPKIAKIDVRIIGLKDYEREPSFECSYDLDGLSITAFQRHIDDLISKID